MARKRILHIGQKDFLLANRNAAKNAGAVTLTTTSNVKNQFTITLVFQDGKSECQKNIAVTTKSIWTMGMDEPINGTEKILKTCFLSVSLQKKKS